MSMRASKRGGDGARIEVDVPGDVALQTDPALDGAALEVGHDGAHGVARFTCWTDSYTGHCPSRTRSATISLAERSLLHEGFGAPAPSFT